VFKLKDSIKTISYKAVVAGNVVKTIRYNAAYIPEWEIPPDFNAKRAVKNFALSIASNYDQWLTPEKNQRCATRMLTLTHRQNLMDYKESYHLFNLFIKRFNHDLLGYKNHELKYSVVPERQKRGAWHYHLALYNIGFNPTLYLETHRLWNSRYHQGNAYWSERPTGMATSKAVYLYMAKYMKKEMENPERPSKHAKRYSCSQGLYKPVVYKDQDALEVDRYCYDNKIRRVSVWEAPAISYREYDLQGLAIPSQSLPSSPSSPSEVNPHSKGIRTEPFYAW
jgi:hypothetical protein